MKSILRASFVVTVVCLSIVIFAFTVGQIIPVEFSSLNNARNVFYRFGYYAIPAGILLTLTGTIQKKDGWKKIASKVAITALSAMVSIAMLVAYLFTLGFGVWVDLATTFRAKEDRRIRIVEQVYDIGAFGYGGRRVVKAVPITPWFNYIEEIDSSAIDKSQWHPVNEEGDVKY
jgi:hypothetical protein